MAPARNRGVVNQLFQFTTCFGILVANLINYFTDEIHPHGWRIALGLAAILAFLMLVGGIFYAETPNSLVEQGRFDEARKVLEKVRGTKKVAAEYQDLVEARALGIPAFQQLTGHNSILFYVPVIFQSIGFGSNASLFSSFITNGAPLVATVISMFLVDKFGRRKFFLEAGFEMICCMVTLALDFEHGKELSKSVSYFLVIVIFLFVLAYGRSWGPLGWLVPRKLFPLEIRSAAQSIMVKQTIQRMLIVGAGFNAFAQKVWMLIVGRMLLGFGIGCANQSVPIYVSEVAPYKYRGALNMMFQLAITIGIFVANVFNYFFAKMKNGEGWRYSLGFAAVPAVMIAIGAIFLPDSPSSLIERGKDEKAKQELIIEEPVTWTKSSRTLLRRVNRPW
ncbi:Sugar transport protein [Arachis hypogaea]|nr:Sugar transport protein [Arachis hypogaea]